MKKKFLKPVLIGILALTLGIGVGITGAYFATQMQATGTITLLNGIELDYTGLTQDGDDYYLQLSATGGALYSSNVSGVFPDTDVTLRQVTVAKSSSANRGDAYVRFSLTYWYKSGSEVSYTKANGINDENLHITTHPAINSTNFTTAGKYNYLTTILHFIFDT